MIYFTYDTAIERSHATCKGELRRILDPTAEVQITFYKYQGFPRVESPPKGRVRQR